MRTIPEMIAAIEDKDVRAQTQHKVDGLLAAMKDSLESAGFSVDGPIDESSAPAWVLNYRASLAKVKADMAKTGAQ